jgi:hypothetical protein
MIAEIQARDPIRSELAAQMAEFEAQFGKVETLPIRIGCAPIPGFTIHVPGKPRPEAKPKRAPGPKKPRANMVIKQQKLAAIRELAGKGLSFADIADQADFTPKMTVKYIMRLVYDYGIKRGPSTNLEG